MSTVITIDDTNFHNYMVYAKALSALVKDLAENSKIDVKMFSNFETHIKKAVDEYNNTAVIVGNVKTLHKISETSQEVKPLLKAYMTKYKEVVLGIVKYIMKQRDESSQEGDYFKQLVQELQSIVAGLLDQAAPSRPTSAR